MLYPFILQGMSTKGYQRGIKFILKVVLVRREILVQLVVVPLIVNPLGTFFYAIK